MRRITAALLLCGAAAALHLGFCEWRTLEFDAPRAAELEARVLVPWRRVEHAAGNADAYDARRDVLRTYHADWNACWDREPDLATCSHAAPTDANATVRAVRRRECAEARGLRVAERPGFRSCLAARGHPRPQDPRWTRDDFGPRFEGPYVTLSALFVEDLGLAPRRQRVLGWLFGVAVPAFACAAALRAGHAAARRGRGREGVGGNGRA